MQARSKQQAIVSIFSHQKMPVLIINILIMLLLIVHAFTHSIKSFV